MENLKYVENYLTASLEVKTRFVADTELMMRIRDVAELIEGALRSGNKLLVAGNGGSAGDAQHMAAEFVSRFFYDRPGLPAIALTTDSSMLTAIGNDYGFDRIFSRQIEAQGTAGDIFIGISTSGNSKNILDAMEQAGKMNISTVALCGSKGQLKACADISLDVPSESTPHIQECHIVIAHAICGLVEHAIFPRE